jgi:CheY-like chemotaxis protein
LELEAQVSWLVEEPTQLNEEHPALTILVAEDDELSASIIQILLEKDGHSATVVPDGREALKLGTESNWDLMIFDIRLPGITGDQVAHTIRHQYGIGTPIFALTANVLPGEKHRYFQCGISAVLSKPATAEKLGQQISKFFTYQAKPLAVSDTTTDFESATIENLLEHLPVEKLSTHLVKAQTFLRDTTAALHQKIPTLEFKELAHEAAGTARNFGLLKLAFILNQLERDAGNETLVSDLIRQYERCLPEQFTALDQYLSSRLK